MNKKKIRIIVISVAAAVIFAAWFIFFRNPTSLKANSAVIFDFLNGKNAKVLRSAEEISCYKGMRLFSGDTVFTDEETKVYIRIDDDRNILLNNSSIIEITQYNQNNLSLTLKQGEFFFDVTHPVGEEQTISMNIMNISMSVRGTSGYVALKGDHAVFDIIEGLGSIEISLEDGSSCLLPVYALDSVSFTNLNTDKPEYSVKKMTLEDLPEIFYDYLKISESYATKLNRNGWRISDKGIILPDNSVNEVVHKESMVGYRENRDGTWTFYQEDYDQGIGPTFYPDYVRIEDVLFTGFTYDGQMHTPEPIGFDTTQVQIEGISAQSQAGSYMITVSPNVMWADRTEEPITVKWTIARKEVTIVVNDQTLHIDDGRIISMTVEGDLASEQIHLGIVKRPTSPGTYQLEPVYIGEYPNYLIKLVKGTVTMLKKENNGTDSGGEIAAGDLPVFSGGGNEEPTILKEFELTAEGYDVIYDGQVHAPSVSVSVQEEGLRIHYLDPYGIEIPAEALNMIECDDRYNGQTITVKATIPGYADEFTTIVCRITKRPVALELTLVTHYATNGTISDYEVVFVNNAYLSQSGFNAQYYIENNIHSGTRITPDWPSGTYYYSIKPKSSFSGLVNIEPTLGYLTVYVRNGMAQLFPFVDEQPAAAQPDITAE